MVCEPTLRQPGRRGMRVPLSRFPSPPKEGMERTDLGLPEIGIIEWASRGNPTCDGAKALRYGAPVGARCVTPDTQRALQGRACETHPEARADDDLEVCETSPPNRCASRRSTANRIVGGRPSPGLHGALEVATRRPAGIEEHSPCKDNSP